MLFYWKNGLSEGLRIPSHNKADCMGMLSVLQAVVFSTSIDVIQHPLLAAHIYTRPVQKGCVLSSSKDMRIP